MLLLKAGFYSAGFMLVPYNKVRYHLREWQVAQLRPATKEELFNLRHSQLRNAIERIFGVLKRKFKILSQPAEFSIQTQIDLILALTAVHNFIMDNDHSADPELDDLYLFDLDDWLPGPPPSMNTPFQDTKEEMNKLRDEIATQMWYQYQEILRVRGLL